MSVPNKSLDKNKRYAGVKANDFVNKTRANEANRSAARPQGWANLGKINSRRIPPPANLPSLKSETGVNPPTFDPTIPTNHGWTSNESPTTINSQSNPTQQQLDSLPVNSPTPPSSADVEKPRVPPTWSTITAGTNPNPPDQALNLLALNDFPRLATTTPDRKSQSESIINIQNPTFRPANLAIWKEGGSGTRIQSLSNDLSQIIPTDPGANLYQQQQNMRMYPPQMWTYNPYTPVPLTIHQQRVNNLNDYKSPTILRNKDIDDLSKITDNTWANTSQEVNYEEKIRFSDDEDFLDTNPKPRRINHQILQHTRLIQDDEHLKQMQDNKNSELINALTIAKQRRDEQERYLKNEQLNHNDEQKHIPGYQTRPLLTSNEQDNSHTSRTRHDTNNSQSSFAMKSWSDQMDSFNYASLHENSTGHMDNDEPFGSNKYNRSQSESSSQSIHDNELISKKPKKPPSLLSKKQQIKPSSSSKKSNKFEQSNDQWENWNESPTTDNRYHQQLHSNDLSVQKSNHYNKQPIRHNDRQQTNSRSKQTTNKIHQSTNNNKTQQVWRPLSPNRPSESLDSTLQETNSYKSQQRTNINDHKQRYQTINTASIPPLMSVRSDPTTTAKLYKTTNHTGSTEYYDDENAYYDSNLQTNQRYHQNRGYTTLGTYGRYRRGGTLRHQQQYPTYNLNNTSGISSAPNTSSGTRQKKNSTNKKTSVVTETNSPVTKTQPIIEEVPITSVVSPTIEIEKSNNPKNGISEQKSENESQIDNQSIKTNKKTPTTSANSKQRTKKDQQNYQHYQNQQPPRHRNNYPRSVQEYEAMQMAYYGTTHRGRHNHMQDLSSGYYYDQSQSHYNNRYNYSNEHYQQSQRSTNKNSKRGGISTTNNRQQIINGSSSSSNNNNNNNRHHSISDNDQKEGEEWETASESSTHMRNGHYDNSGINNQRTNDNTKAIHRGRTPPKKSFSSQRPNARQILKYTNA